MSDPQPVRITGGTFFIGLMLLQLLIQTCGIANRLDRVLERMPPKTVEKAP